MAERSIFEPEADGLVAGAMRELGDADAAQAVVSTNSLVSIAISLKRIADSLEAPRSIPSMPDIVEAATGRDLDLWAQQFFPNFTREDGEPDDAFRNRFRERILGLGR